MGKDRKHMERIRKKRIESLQKQIESHEEKIETEKGEKTRQKITGKKKLMRNF